MPSGLSLRDALVLATLTCGVRYSSRNKATSFVKDVNMI